jgi:hypothetical protein
MLVAQSFGQWDGFISYTPDLNSEGNTSETEEAIVF